MNAAVGMVLALAALLGGGLLLGWQGVILALTVIVFWLLLQFSRLMRVMQAANAAPVGRVDSAVMLQSRLRQGMKLMDVLPLTRSLGVKVEGRDDAWAWTDAGGIRLELQFHRGALQQWELLRVPEQAAESAEARGGAA